jgi:hypothetical protein
MVTFKSHKQETVELALEEEQVQEMNRCLLMKIWLEVMMRIWLTLEKNLRTTDVCILLSFR